MLITWLTYFYSTRESAREKRWAARASPSPPRAGMSCTSELFGNLTQTHLLSESEIPCVNGAAALHPRHFRLRGLRRAVCVPPALKNQLCIKGIQIVHRVKLQCVYMIQIGQIPLLWTHVVAKILLCSVANCTTVGPLTP